MKNFIQLFSIFDFLKFKNKEKTYDNCLLYMRQKRIAGYFIWISIIALIIFLSHGRYIHNMNWPEKLIIGIITTSVGALYGILAKNSLSIRYNRISLFFSENILKEEYDDLERMEFLTSELPLLKRVFCGITIFLMFYISFIFLSLFEIIAALCIILLFDICFSWFQMNIVFYSIFLAISIAILIILAILNKGQGISVSFIIAVIMLIIASFVAIIRIFEILNNETYEISQLSPRENINIKEYDKFLTRAIYKNKFITNIAVTGNFGIGKSSVIKSFEKKHHKRFLYVSLADYRNNKNRSSQDKETFELSILKQILSRCRQKDIPSSSFKVVPDKKIKLGLQLV